MFGKFRKRHPKVGVEQDTDGGAGGLWEEDLPVIDPPYVTLLKRSKGGPYYLTPDSAEPLPSGMWSKLDPETVEQEAKRVNRLLGGEWKMGVVQPALRKSLLTQGPLGHRIIEALEGPKPSAGQITPKRPDQG